MIIILWLFDLTNKLHDAENFFDFILCNVLSKIALFYQTFL